MRCFLAMIASIALVHGFDGPAFAFQRGETVYPAPEAAVAVAIGLAWANSGTIELPVTVEIAEPDAQAAPPAGPEVPAPRFMPPPDAHDPAGQPVEWVRICGPNGCQWIPGPGLPDRAHVAPEIVGFPAKEDSHAAPPSASSGDQPRCQGDGCGLSPRRRLFGGRR
jgi:hypothetical protein